MKNDPVIIDEHDIPSYPLELEAAGSLWMLIPKAGAGVLLSVILILTRFWLEFRELPSFAFGFAGFIAALQILIIIGLRFVNRSDVRAAKADRGDWLDKLGAWWLMTCFIGAFFGWLCGALGDIFPLYWKVFYAGKAFLTIVLPVATMLPNLRYIRRNAAYVQVPLMVFVTMLPILVGIGSAFDLVYGVGP